MKFPFVFRPGSILPLSAEEYQRVKSAFYMKVKNQPLSKLPVSNI